MWEPQGLEISADRAIISSLSNNYCPQMEAKALLCPNETALKIQK
jgi:hypothetical protein